MPFVDAHQHFWSYNPRDYGWMDAGMAGLRRDFLPPDLETARAGLGFSGGIAVQARQSLEETRWLLALAEADPRIVAVVGWVDLLGGDLRGQLKRFAASPKFRGVRHLVQDEADDRFMLRPAFLDGIGALSDFNLCYDILVRPGQLPAALELVARFPEQAFVLDHLGKPPIKDHALEPWSSLILRLAEHRNVSCKVSGMVTEADWRAWRPEDLAPYLELAFKAFGGERLMFGSDWPVCTLAADYHRVLAVVRDFIASRPSRFQEGLLGINALNIYGCA